MTDADDAYAKAEEIVEKAIQERAEALSFWREVTHALDQLPSRLSEIRTLRTLDLSRTQIRDIAPLATITSITRLNLSNTRITDVAPLSGMTAMIRLDLSRTQVHDLRPLAGMTRMRRLALDYTPVTDLKPLLPMYLLGEEPSMDGLSFRECGAAKYDPIIAEISKIREEERRARKLFTHLKDWGPPKSDNNFSRPSVTGPLVNRSAQPKFERNHPTSQSWHTARSLLARTPRSELASCVPSLRARTQRLVELVQQERALHSLIPKPNSEEALAEYEEKTEFLETVKSELFALHESLPNEDAAPLTESQAQTLRESLARLAKLADRCVQYLDNDRGTYGGLYKIGLISAVAGLLSLVPGVSFLMGAALPSAVLGAQTVNLRIGREG